MHTAKYPVSSALEALLRKHGHDRVTLIWALGYRNTVKGLRRLDRWLRHGELEPAFFQGVCRLFPQDKTALIEALEQTVAIKHKERELQALVAFTPGLYAETEHGPENSIAAMEARQLRFVRIERGCSVERAGALAREHYARREGQCGRFGKILGYRFEPEFRKVVHLGIDGALVAKAQAR